MAYSALGLNSALVGGIAQDGDLLSLHTADPGTTGAGEDMDVPRQPANWGDPTGANVDSAEVPFEIPAAAAARTYRFFGVRRAAGDWVGGGQLDEPEVYSANGGLFNFTATLTSQNAA